MKQRQFLNVLDREEAERRWLAALTIARGPAETVALSQALGRVLADDVRAEVDVPSFDRSNMDGFAVQSADTFGAMEETPVRLVLNDETLPTGVVPTQEVRAGTATSIATGGMLPRGADAVVPVEHTDLDADGVVIQRPVVPGAAVSFAGTDIGRGETVLFAGTRLTSRETGMLAAIGAARVSVVRRPRVAILSTGDEIVAPGEPMRPGLVYDSNARILADAVRELGGEPRFVGSFPDDVAALRAGMEQAIGEADVVLLSGGTSKGEGDLNAEVVAELDPGIVVHGVALKPGKPICLAAHHGLPVVILPGFPTSAVFTFHEFVAPVLRRLQGLGPTRREAVRARLAVPVSSVRGRMHFLLVGLVTRPGEATLAAYPMRGGSGSVTTFSRADGFVRIPRHTELVEADTDVEVTLLGRGLEPPDLAIIGSHCAGLDLICGALVREGLSVKLMAVGSQAGLAAAARGECDVAPIHLLDPESDTYNTPFLTPDLRLLNGYVRTQGVVTRLDDERDIEDLLADPALRMVNRNRGAGTRILLDRLLGERRPPGYAYQPRSHYAVAAAISQGRADWGVTIETIAAQAGLRFRPLREERYDFAVPRDRWDRPAVRRLRELLGGRSGLRSKLEERGFPGHD